MITSITTKIEKKNGGQKRQKAKHDNPMLMKNEQLKKYKKKRRKLCVITLTMDKNNIYK